MENGLRDGRTDGHEAKSRLVKHRERAWQYFNKFHAILYATCSMMVILCGLKHVAMFGVKSVII